MGKIKEIIKLNITAVYTFEQTKKVLKKLNKKVNLLSLFSPVEWQIKEKIHFQFLKKVYL